MAYSSSCEEDFEVIHLPSAYDESDKVPASPCINKQSVFNFKKPQLSSSKRSRCQNETCHRKFGKIRTPYVCQRCGRLYCKSCTKRFYSDTVNYFIVCVDCYAQLPVGVGQTRNLMPYFKKYHQQNLNDDDKISNGLIHQPKIFNLYRECLRLKEGFKTSMGSSTFKTILYELKSWVEEPDWQKSSFHVSPLVMEHCMLCKIKFSKLQRRYNCNVCGIVTCKKCISSDLLLYFSDELAEGEIVPKLCIIKIIGCPDKEPHQAMYLKVCTSCSQAIQNVQIEEYKQSIEEEKSKDFVHTLTAIYESLRMYVIKIDKQLPKFQELVTSLHSGQNIIGPVNNTASQVAKAFGDLSDHLSQMMLESTKLKKMRGPNNSQEMLLKNINLCYINYYQESNYVFNEMWRTLKDIIPREILKEIQDVRDEHSINNTFLSVRQLALEALLLCEEYKLSLDVVKSIGNTEKLIQDDLRNYLQHDQQMWDNHMIKVNEFLKLQIKNHRFVHLSKQQAKERGAGYVVEVLHHRSINILSQILLQLEARCSDKKFDSSKKAIENLILELDEETTIPENVILLNSCN